ARREPAPVEMTVRGARLELGLDRASREGVRATRCKATTWGQVDERRWQPPNRLEPLRPRLVDPRDRAEEPPGVRVLRIVEDVGGRRAFDDAPRVHNRDPVRD